MSAAIQTSPERRVGTRAEQKRRWDRENRRLCGCGALMSRHAAVCRSCEEAIRRAGRDQRRARIAQLWNEGASLVEIAEALATTRSTIGVEMQRMRRAGIDLPYRRKGAG